MQHILNVEKNVDVDQKYDKTEQLWPIYTERQHQRYIVASDIALIKLLRFLNKPSE